MVKQLIKNYIEYDLRERMKESQIKEQKEFEKIKNNICTKCGNKCLFKEYLHDDHFIKEIMPSKDEGDYLKCILMKDVLEDDNE